MNSKRSNFIFRTLLSFFALLTAPNLFAEDVNLSTYYPSPYGSYRRLQIEDAEGPVGTFTGGVTQAGLQIISTYTAGSYTPGIFWTTSNNNATRPKAGIWMLEEDDVLAGSSLRFGTSSNYSTGINTSLGMILDHDGQLGVGTFPTAPLDVRVERVTPRAEVAEFVRYENSARPAALSLIHGRGTMALPASVQNNDGLGSVRFQGMAMTGGGLGIFSGPEINATATANWTTTSTPSSLSFSTVPASSTTPVEALRINESGAADYTVDSSTVRLPRKASTGDPAGGQNGMVYYNTADRRFRVYQDGAWVDLVASGNVGCVSITTGIADIGYTIFPLTLNGRNICEDSAGCSVSIWSYRVDKPAGVHYYENSAQVIRQRLYSGNHHWHFSYSDGAGVNGDGTPVTLISNWHGFYLYDDQPTGVDVGDSNNFDAMTIRDNTATYGFTATFCDTV